MDKRVIPALTQDIQTLKRIADRWQYATYRPQGLLEFIDLIYSAKHIAEDLVDNIERTRND